MSLSLKSSSALLQIRQQCQQVFLGSPLIIDMVLTAWLAGGHVLLEDRPGLGKTTLGQDLECGVSWIDAASSRQS